MSIVIRKIEFKNFRQYGTGTIRFETNKESKLSVIVAKNGTGKTTLLNSITWCLYEKEQQLVDKKTALSVVSTAELEEAAEGETIPVYVIVTIQDEDTEIEFKRIQYFKKNFDKNGNSIGVPSATTFTAKTILLDKNNNAYIESGVDAEMKVKKYFDPAIYDFYFFDGEKLKEFFSTEKTAHIKGSIYNIAQVTLLQTAYEHVGKLRSEKMRDISKSSPDFSELFDAQARALENRDRAEKTIETTKIQKEKDETELDRVDELLRGYAPIKNLQNERIQLEEKLRRYDQEKADLVRDRAAFIRKYVVLLNLYPRIKKTLQIIRVKEEAGDLPPMMDRNQIKLVLENLDKPCPLCNNPHIGETGKQHLEKLLNQISVSSKTSNYLKEIKSSLETYLEDAEQYQERKNILLEREMVLDEKVDEAEERLQTINRNLSNFTTSDGNIDVVAVEKERTQLRSQISQADRTIGMAEADLKSLNSKLNDLAAQLDVAQKKFQVKSNLKSQVSLLVKIEDYYKTIKDHITTSMREEIQKTTWDIFDSMIWKKNTFGKILIGENYDVSVYNKDGAVMTGSLSATEQMALAYSFTLAIHRASGKNCPLVIDSPLGRVSDENRENMAKALLEISREKQIIMLFTPDEYSAAVRTMYDSVADVRTIQLSDDEKYVEGIEE